MAYEIAFGVDTDYVKYAGIVMTSIAAENAGEEIGFHLVCDGIAEEDIERLQEFRAAFPRTDVYIYDARAALDDLPFPHGIPHERINCSVFTRILMPELVPQELTRILYLDADTLCVGRLAGLYAHDLGTAPLAAAREGDGARKAQRIGMRGTDYFNAGVMLLDLARWRSMQLTARVLDAWRTHGASFPLLEQDALNSVLDGDFAVLEKRHVRMMDAFAPWDVDFAAEHPARGCAATAAGRSSAAILQRGVTAACRSVLTVLLRSMEARSSWGLQPQHRAARRKTAPSTAAIVHTSSVCTAATWASAATTSTRS